MPEKGFVADKIRILFILPSPGAGGAELQLYYLLKDLDRTRFEAALTIFYSHGALRADFQAIPGLKIHDCQKKSGLDFAYLFSLCKFMQKNHFDIIQAYNASARLVGLVLAWWHRIPITIMTERNASPVYSSWASRFYHFCERYAMRSATVVVANSQAGYRYCVQRGIAGQRIRVINNGLDLQRLKSQRTRLDLQIRDQDFVIGMIARLFPQKDPITFLQAARIVLSRRSDVLFLLIGDGPLRRRVQKLVQARQLGERVRLVGYTSAVADYLAAMDVLVLSSRQSEGCANAVLEGMAMAKPVIVTDVPGNRELVAHEQTGLVVAPENASQLCQAIEDLLDHPDKRKQLATRAQQMVLHAFDMKVMVESYQRLYSECMNPIRSKQIALGQQKGRMETGRRRNEIDQG